VEPKTSARPWATLVLVTMAVATLDVLALTVGVSPAIASADFTTLAVWHAGQWRTFWRSDRAPVRWTAPDSTVLRALEWKPVARGVEWANVRLACPAPVWRARIIVARIDPREVTLRLDMDVTRGDLRPAWTIDHAPENAILAVNAGQFDGAMPWGWVFLDGKQRLEPGHGPLSSCVAIDASGGVTWSHGDSMATPNRIVTGFQSYPTLLAGQGVVPAPLRTQGSGVSLTHRDARLALGETRDGHLLVAMTRFDALGDVAQEVPLGPTTPEMAAIMGALGACDAVMLDGGISAQMLLRSSAAEAPLRWFGNRKVPLALIATARSSITP